MTDAWNASPFYVLVIHGSDKYNPKYPGSVGMLMPGLEGKVCMIKCSLTHWLYTMKLIFLPLPLLVSALFSVE